MKKYIIGFFALAAAAYAQVTPTTTATTTDRGFVDSGYTREFTIGGGGGANTEIDSSFGSVNLSLGQYTTENNLWSLRQSVMYVNPDGGSQSWNGWTRLAYDRHFGTTGAWRPFVGVNAGRIYGDAVHDSWTAGLETGAKYYVTPRTFVQLTVEYGWFFDNGDNFDTQFHDGQWSWGVGVGYRF
ncbi:MAG: outer membrane beta-barrel protein [Verrucomicrobia bacterium]|nr:outer membrane beta-barrel protein [Verrucomicrobiota bacterium]